MDLFGDKQYEELDWLTKAIEPIADTLNEKLANLPDIVKVDFKVLAHRILYDYLYHISIEQLLLSAKLDINNDESIFLCKYYEIAADDVIVDFESGVSVGAVFLKKIAVALSEKDAKSRMNDVVARSCYRKNSILANYINNSADEDTITSRLNEVLDVLDSKDGLRARSLGSKQEHLRCALSTSFREDKFKVRDVQLAEKITSWAYDYTITGDLSKITNLCRIKVMAYSGKPIYKFEETV